jgi:hypothetical protein
MYLSVESRDTCALQRKPLLNTIITKLPIVQINNLSQCWECWENRNVSVETIKLHCHCLSKGKTFNFPSAVISCHQKSPVVGDSQNVTLPTRHDNRTYWKDLSHVMFTFWPYEFVIATH